MDWNNICEIAVVAYKAPVEKIVKKYLYHPLTPETVHEIKFYLDKAGYDAKSIIGLSARDAFMLEEDNVTHFYYKDGIWYDESV